MAALDKLKTLMQPAETMVGAGVAGYIAGVSNGMPKLGADANGEGGVPYDLLGGVALVAGGFFNVGGNAVSSHLTAVGTGMLAYFAGGFGAEMGVKSAKATHGKPSSSTTVGRGWDDDPRYAQAQYAPAPRFAQHQQVAPDFAQYQQNPFAAR